MLQRAEDQLQRHVPNGATAAPAATEFAQRTRAVLQQSVQAQLQQLPPPQALQSRRTGCGCGVECANLVLRRAIYGVGDVCCNEYGSRFV